MRDPEPRDQNQQPCKTCGEFTCVCPLCLKAKGGSAVCMSCFRKAVAVEKAKADAAQKQSEAKP